MREMKSGFEPRSKIDSSLQLKSGIDLDSIKNWEERGGKIYIKKIEAVPTPLWHDGWYRNPTSGRSNNFGMKSENGELPTIIAKGGCFFTNEKCKEFFEKHSIKPSELYGGITLDAAKKEHDIAALVQERFHALLNKKANCPEPIDVTTVTGVLNERNEAVDLVDFFIDEANKEEGKTGFTTTNFIQYAMNAGIDVRYPSSQHADQRAKDDPYRWLFGQCLEKEKQGVYRYKIEGANTRLLDLMTLDLPDRRKHFMQTNDATSIREAAEKFASKLGEFYGVLHKSNIGYHGGVSEHCSLVDITISGTIMDIGGLSRNNSLDDSSLAYLAQFVRAANVIAYLCQNILKLNEAISERALRVFWKTYKKLYVDAELENFFKLKGVHRPAKIWPQYIDSLAGDWIKLAPDLKDLAWDGI